MDISNRGLKLKSKRGQATFEAKEYADRMLIVFSACITTLKSPCCSEQKRYFIENLEF